VGARHGQSVSVGRTVQVGTNLSVAEGSGVGVLGVAVGVRVGVWVGQRVSVGRVAGPAGASVLVVVRTGVGVRVGSTGVSVGGNVAVGEADMLADGVALPGVTDRPPFCLLRS